MGLCSGLDQSSVFQGTDWGRNGPGVEKAWLPEKLLGCWPVGTAQKPSNALARGAPTPECTKEA